MSELKAFKSERIYWAVEQVEREAGDIDNLHLDDNLFYIKSEADKVIARHKYKRCLAMAEWCNSEMGRETFACFRPRHTKEVWREEHKYWAKWRKIWFELYIKFKEAK